MTHENECILDTFVHSSAKTAEAKNLRQAKRFYEKVETEMLKNGERNPKRLAEFLRQQHDYHISHDDKLIHGSPQPPFLAQKRKSGCEEQ